MGCDYLDMPEETHTLHHSALQETNIIKKIIRQDPNIMDNTKSATWQLRKPGEPHLAPLCIAMESWIVTIRYIIRQGTHIKDKLVVDFCACAILVLIF